MSRDQDLVRKLFDGLVREATDAGIPSDLVGRLTIAEVIALWKRERGVRDIGSELVFIAEHLDPDTPYEFIRP